MLQRIDHIVIVVKDLAQTIRDYEQLGFEVVIGGEHAHRGSHNALISFQDGSYIELIAFHREPTVKDNFWWDFLQRGEGLVDFALVSDDLGTELERLRLAGFDITGPMDGGRVRPDGVEVAWRIGRVKTDTVDRLPFLIEDVTRRELRVPTGVHTHHPNGVTGIERVIVAVPSISTALPTYRSLVGAADSSDIPEQLRVGSHAVELTDGSHPDPDIAQFLELRQSGLYRVLLRSGAGAESGSVRDLDLRIAHSARLAIV